MKRTGEMQVNVAGLRRNLKNIAHNYSDAQKKVREATSNDPWGPSSTIMAEVSDLTYNVVAFTEIMQMIWKRLNDHGRNWRHVYKALVLLEYLIKTGSEKVGQQCKENIFAIQTLKDFQYMEEGKDQGQNVREKAKQLVNLLKDDERLRNERARAIKAKERFAQTACGFGSDGGLDTPTSPKYPNYRGGAADWNSTTTGGSRESSELPREIEVARPQTAGEEELQLQLALAMSREEAEQEEQKRRSDDVRLQLALSQSQQDFKNNGPEKGANVLDLLDVNLDDEKGVVDPWGMPQVAKPAPSAASPWHGNMAGSLPLSADPWAPSANNPAIPPPGAPKAPPQPGDPWNPQGVTTALVETAIRNDPWSPVSHSSSELDDFDAITNRNRNSPLNNGNSAGNNNADLFELNLLGDTLPIKGPDASTGATKKTPQSFLGENSALVNLDNLVTKPTTTSTTSGGVGGGGSSNQLNAANPFSETQQQQQRQVMFNQQPPKPSMNQIKQTPFMATAASNNQHHMMDMVNSSNNFNNQSSALGSSSFMQTNGAVAFGALPTSNVSSTGGGAAADPWTPVPSSNPSQLGAPWMKPGCTF